MIKIITRDRYQQLLGCESEQKKLYEACRNLREFDWLLRPMWLHLFQKTIPITACRDQMRRAFYGHNKSIQTSCARDSRKLALRELSSVSDDPDPKTWTLQRVTETR